MGTNPLPPELWVSWQEFNRKVCGKQIIFFGVSDDWVVKTLQKSNLNLVYLVDNSNAWIGETFNDVNIKNPEVLKTKKKDEYVVITSGAFESIYPQLIEYGLKPGLDFCVSPALNNLKVISNIHSHSAKLLVTSPDHHIYAALDKNVGGGLFVYDINNAEYKKVLEGTFHQIVDTGEKYYIIDEKRGVCEVAKDFKLIDTFSAGQGGKCHGIAYCANRGLIFVSQTAKDTIAAYNAKTTKLTFDIVLSDKLRKTGKPSHWINDLCVRGDYLYASLFSWSGGYPEGVYDGSIVRIDLDNLEDRQVLVRDLWMPHTVRFFDSEICFLDSMRGYFYKTDKNIIGEFFGFIRGLAYDGMYYYVGQSETRYFDRLKGIRKNIGMSAGFYLFDEDTKAAKFFSIPHIRQVRDLCVLTD